MPNDSVTSLPLQIDSACAHFQDAWRNNGRPRIEDYLTHWASGGENLFRRLLVLETAGRRRDGEALTAEEYLRRFPEYREIVADVLAPLVVDDRPSTLNSIDASTVLQSDSEPTAPQADKAPERLGDYELIEPIGRGGMGVVYRARQISLNRIVALKMIRAGELADDEQVRRFRAEAEAVAQLDHPGIVPVYEVGEAAGRHYFSMALVDGASLSERIAQQPFSSREAAELVRQVALAVSYAHGRGVIHRDLKPSNVLLGPDGEPKVTDFGLAKRITGDSELTATGQVLGTPSYMPPEQAAGRIGEIRETADVYSLGAILYALITGRPPFQADNPVSTLKQVLEQEPISLRQFNAKLPLDLETICLKCLEKDPQRRYASAQELADELQRFTNGEPITARPVGAVGRMWRWCKRKPVTAGLIGGVAASLLAGIAVSSYFAVLANERAERALEGTRIALTTLESVIFDLQEKLRDIPQARGLRRELLRNSLKDLEAVSGELRARRQIDRDTASVLVDLGYLYRQMGDDEGNQARKSAEANFVRALEIYRRLHQANPGDEKIQHGLARTCEHLGELYLDARRVTDAREPFVQMLELRERLVREHPENRKYRYELSWSHTSWGDLQAMSGDQQGALAAYRKAETLCRRLVEEDPAKESFRERLADTLEKSGDAQFTMGDVAAAAENYETSHAMYRALHEANADSAEMQLSLSTSYERMGDLRLRQGDHQAARDAYEMLLELTLKAVEGDSDNLQFQADLVVAYDKMRNTSQRLGDTETAQDASKKAQELRQKLSQEGL